MLEQSVASGRRWRIFLKRCVQIVVLTAGTIPVAAAIPLATTTTLLVSGGVTVSPGMLVTFTAQVTSSGTTGGAAVTPGLVDLCDATATYCTDIHLLGTAQLTTDGIATFRLFPGPGIHSYKAAFVGTNSYAASESAVTFLAVNGKSATMTSLTATGSSINYTLTAKVSGGTIPLSGNVSFYEAGPSLLGPPVALGSSTSSSLSWAGGTQPYSIAVADFNGDGQADLAVSDYGSNTVTVLLGNGNGTFTPVSTISTTGNGPRSVATGDFNSDGIADLVVANFLNSTVTVLLGAGDGTFPSTSTTLPIVGTGSQPNFVAVGDFNGDGIADLAVSDLVSGKVNIFKGTGGGNFTPLTAPATGTSPASIALGDLNGDGNLDMAVANSGSDTVSVFLGKGDGTFGAATTFSTGSGPISIAVADVNGDGIADLAVGCNGSGTVTVYLGKGDGTFPTVASTTSTGSGTYSVTAGDFNGDGKVDLAAANSLDNTATILLGDGTGGFTTAATSPTGNYPIYVAAVNFNNSNSAGLAIANAHDNSVTVLPTELTATAVLAVPSIGAEMVWALYSGDSNHFSSRSPNITVPSSPAARPVLSVGSATYTSGQTVSMTDVTPGAVIFYTTDGTTPGTGSTVYSRPIPVNSTETIKAIAAASGYMSSPVATSVITILIPPSITTSPANQTILYGKTATLSVVATGTAPLSYQWYQGVSPNTTSPLPGATSASFTTPALSATTSYWVQVSNASAQPAQSATATVSVIQPPVCSLSVQGASTRLTVSVNATCSDPQKQPLTETINWGDGTTVTVLPANLHTYSAAGTYTIVLIATNTSGLTGSAQTQVTPTQLPVCTLGIVEGTAATYAVSVPATCSDPQNQPLTATINWGDGVVAPAINNSPNPHTYPGSGTYNVILVGVDASGLAGESVPQPVNVLVQTPPVSPGGSTTVTGSIPPPPPVAVGTEVTFICSSVSANLNGQAVNNALPAQFGISCTSPTIALTASSIPVSVTIQTTTATIAATTAMPNDRSLTALGVVVCPTPVLAFLIARSRRSRSKYGRMLALPGLMTILCLSLASCGGRFTPPAVVTTPTGQYYITIVETVVNPPAPTGFVQTSLIVPLQVTSTGH